MDHVRGTWEINQVEASTLSIQVQEYHKILKSEYLNFEMIIVVGILVI